MDVAKSKLETYFERDFIPSQDNWKALCPSHEERSPSFYVHKEEGLAHCFGCGISGYVENILADYRHISREEAAELLGIEKSTRLAQKFNPRCLVIVPEIYPESWLAPWPKKIHKYILERLGEDAFTILRSAGVRYDPITRRQVFPHRDRKGNLVGAFGRSTDNREPKYYFYWGYRKGCCLYDPWVSDNETIVVTEGPLDVIKLRELGIDAASTLGTEFSQDQIKRLKKYNEVIIAFDNDLEGRNAAAKLHRDLNRSTKVKFILWPDHRKDFVDIADGDLIKRLVANAVSYVSWRTLS